MMAQNITVSGVVTSKTDGEPLIGATVRVKGTNQGTATDIDGNYTLPNVAKNATLIFNYVGFAELSPLSEDRPLSMPRSPRLLPHSMSWW